jgi:tetratricopeptide (TPR) repeat protein
VGKFGRNDPCPCGSKKKYKHCCLGKEPRTPAMPVRATPFPTSPPPQLDPTADEIILGDTYRRPVPETPLDRARELVIEAWDSRGVERVRRAREALAHSPDCAEAYTLLGHESGTPEEAIALYQQAMATAERLLAPGWQRSIKHRDWDEPAEVDAYLDARTSLAEAHATLGRLGEAIAQYRAVLDLDPDDFDGVRYKLLDALLADDRDGEALDLLADYPLTLSARWPYARALLTYRRDGDALWARRAIVDAIIFDPRVPVYLLDPTALPAEDVDDDWLGLGAEAADAARTLRGVWERTPGALDWLRTIYAAGPKARLDAVPRGDGPALCVAPSDAIGFIRCPRCEEKTKPRKRDVVLLLEPDEIAIAHLGCRLCETCDILCLLADDLERAAERATRRHGGKPGGRDYVALGIIDPQAEDRPAGVVDATWADDHLRRWRDQVSAVAEPDDWQDFDDLGDDLDDLDPFAPAAGIVDVPYEIRPD